QGRAAGAHARHFRVTRSCHRAASDKRFARSSPVEEPMFFNLVRLGLLAALCVVATPPVAHAGELVSATFAAKAYPGSRERRYRVFVPSSYDTRAPVPMVMVLHGCQQTEQDMIAQTGFSTLAE